jgi:hypothetical protein
MESIERFVLEQLDSWEVPGCAVAAVRDGRAVLAAGWGRRDLDAKLPVTPDTLFAIGSTTKAFTASTVGALVEDGLLEWERQLRDYVPELRAFQYSNLGLPGGGARRGGALRHQLGGFPAHPAAGAAGDGPLQPVGRGHDRRPGPARARDPEVLRGLCGTYAMGPIEIVVALRGDHVLTVAVPGAAPLELQPAGRGLRFEVKGQPGVTAEFELDDTGAVARLVAQPLGMFLPKA